MFAIMVDETTDESKSSQLVVLARHVSSDFSVAEDLLGIHSMKKCNSEAISLVIFDTCLRYNFEMKNCRGQAYDGASVMMGSRAGVGVRVQEKEPRAIVVHCQAHSLNLAVQDVVASIPKMNHFLSVVQQLLVFLRGSPKRLSELKALSKEATISGSLRPLCPHRWTLRYTALQSIDQLIP